MKEDNMAIEFLSRYDDRVLALSLALRAKVVSCLPDATEQVDLSARMIAYCYGQRYIDMVCTIIPSKKGVKLGFYKGVDLPDPDKLLRGTRKISRYIEIREASDVRSSALRKLLMAGLAAYKKRMAEKKR